MILKREKNDVVKSVCAIWFPFCIYVSECYAILCKCAINQYARFPILTDEYFIRKYFEYIKKHPSRTDKIKKIVNLR